MMNRHIDQQRMPEAVMQIRLYGGRVGITTEINVDGTDAPKRLLTYQLDHLTYSRREAIVLADHQDTLLLLRQFDGLARLRQGRRKRLLQQNMLARFQSCLRARHMP